MNRSSRWCALTVACLVASVVHTGAAVAADQFTLDAHPDSFGAVVTDASGDAYVAWEHTSSPANVPTFCKLRPGASRCTYRVGLPLPAGSSESPLQPFPIVGPDGLVLVVANRYVSDDTLIWTSTNGGQSFSGPRDIPLITSPDSSLNGNESYSYSGLTGVDDLLPFNFTNDDLYAEGSTAGALPGSQTSTGVPALAWYESSVNPGLGFNFDASNETAGGDAGVTEFDFDNPGSGGVAGSTLGISGFGSTSPSAPSDVVEAYWLESDPVTLDYYHYSYTGTQSGTPEQPNWSGPQTLGDAYEPRLAGGAAGLFLLSVDAPSGHGPASVVQVRKYDQTTHTFGAPLTLADEPAGGELFDGGGLGENADTGELAAVWPQYPTTGPDTLRLYLSTDSGQHFTAGQDIATDAGFADDDNARVAVTDDGAGYVTFQDDAGLQISDLYPLGSDYHGLRLRKRTVSLPVTCPAAKGTCKVQITLTGPHSQLLAGHHFVIGAGATTIKLKLGTAALARIAKHHSATLTIVIHPPGAPAHTITAPVIVK